MLNADILSLIWSEPVFIEISIVKFSWMLFKGPYVQVVAVNDFVYIDTKFHYDLHLLSLRV